MDNFLIYKNAQGDVRVEVLVEGETVWLSQKAIAELFGVGRPAVTKHLLNIFEYGELVEDSVCSILEHTAIDGKRYKVKLYNLDGFLQLGDYPILAHKGKVTALEARLKAEAEFERFRVASDLLYESDFDREIKHLLACDSAA